MVKDLLARAFEGSSSSLVAHLLEQSKPSDEELKAIRRTIEEYQREGRS
jgi:predicted transcriptional regulator